MRVLTAPLGTVTPNDHLVVTKIEKGIETETENETENENETETSPDKRTTPKRQPLLKIRTRSREKHATESGCSKKLNELPGCLAVWGTENEVTSRKRISVVAEREERRVEEVES